MGNSSSTFQLEALEQRILLSGNDLLQDLRSGMQELPDLFQQVEVSSELLGQEVALLGDKAGDVADIADGLTDIFAGLEDEDFASADALERALDELADVDARVVIGSADEVAIEITITSGIDASVTAELGSSILNSDNSGLSATLDLGGTSSLTLRIGADADGFFLDTDHSALDIDIDFDGNPVLNGKIAGSAVTSTSSDVDLDLHIDVDFQSDNSKLRLSELTDSPVNEFTTTVVSGQASLSAQLVELNHASNPPPSSIDLIWNDASSTAPSSIEVNLVSSGLLAPGNSPGTTNVTSLTLGTSSVTEIEIGGLNAGSQFDQIIVANLATLAGTLDVNLINGFTPNVGDTFDIITFGSVSGAIADADGLYGFEGGEIFFQIVEQSDKLQLVVVDFPVRGFEFASNSQSELDDLGEFLNRDYLTDASADTASLTGTLTIGEVLDIDGSFFFSDTTDGFSVGVTDADLSLLDLLDLHGDFTFEVGGTEVVNLQTGIPANLINVDGVAADMQAIAAASGATLAADLSTLNGLSVNTYRIIGSGVSGFFGFGDATFNGSNEITNGDDLTGLGFENLEFAIGFFTPTESALSDLGLPDFLALKATANSLTIYGLSSLVEATGEDITIAINRNVRLANISIPDLDIPNFTLPTIELPSLLLPDLDLPSISLPDLGFPSFDIPSLNLTGFSIPSFSLPDINLPEIDLPSLSLPDLDLSLSIPDISLPNIDLPSISLPNLSLPNINLSLLLPSIPNLSLPSLTLPSLSLPALTLTLSLPDLDLPDLDLSFPTLPDLQLPDLNLPNLNITLRLPDLDLSGFGLPNLSLPDLVFPTISLPTLSLPLINLPDFDLSGIGFPTLTLPTISLPDLSFTLILPDLSLPNLDLSGFSLLDLVFPDFDGIELPSLSLPDFTFPTFTLPSLELPDLDLSALGLPDFAFPSISLPSFDLPSVSLPSLSLPNLLVPSFNLADFPLPSLSLPSINLPSISLPDLRLPEFDITFPNMPTLRLPSLSLPSISLGSISLPDLDLPDIDLSGLGLPSIVLPTISLPDLALPDIALPDLKLPDLKLPNISIPDIDLPGITLSDQGDPFIDFVSSFPPSSPAGYPIETASGTTYLDFEEKLFKMTVADLNVRVAEFLELSGSAAFEIGPTHLVDIDTGLPAALGVASQFIQPTLDDLSNGANATIAGDLSTIENLEVSTITLGASGLNGFIGVGDPDLDADLDSQDLYGFGLTNVNFGLAIFKSTVPIKKLPKLTSLRASVGSFTTHGFGDIFDLEATGIEVRINNGSKWQGTDFTPAIDIKKSFETSDGAENGTFEVETGGTPVSIDFDGNVRKGLSIEDLRLQISEFLLVSGSASFEKGPTELVDVATGIPANLSGVLGPLVTAANLQLGGVTTPLSITNDLAYFTDVEVESTQFGLSGVDAFVGYGATFNSDGSIDTSDAFGITVAGVDLGLGIFDPTLYKVPGVSALESILQKVLPKRFIALTASAESGGLVGFDDFIELTASGILLNINDARDYTGSHGPPVIDFTKSFESSEGAGDGAYSVLTGATNSDGSAETIDITFNGNQRIGASVEDFRFRISEFVLVSGAASFEKGPTELVDVNTGIPANLAAVLEPLVTAANDLLDDVTTPLEITDDLGLFLDVEVATTQIGLANVNAFVGLGASFNANGSINTDDAIGFKFTDVDVGFAVFNPTLYDLPGAQLFESALRQILPKQFHALKINAETAELVGFDPLVELTASGFEVVINGATEFDSEIHGPPIIDFAASFADSDPIGYEVKTGAEPVYLDFDGEERVGVSVQQVDLIIAQFFYLSGSFAFEKGPGHSVTIATGLPGDLGQIPGAGVVADALNSLTGIAGVTVSNDFGTISGYDVSSMTIGASNVSAFLGIGTPDFSSSLLDQDLFGFFIQNLDFGMAIFEPGLEIEGLPSAQAAKATAESFGFIGGGELFEITGQGLEIQYNSGDDWFDIPGLGPATIDYLASFPDTGGFEVPAGQETVLLDFDGNERIRVSLADARINIFDFIHLRGSFAFEKGPAYAVNATIPVEPINNAFDQFGIPVQFPAALTYEVDSMTIGASNVFAFVGIGGVDSEGAPNDGAIGFSIQDFDFGFGMFKPTALGIIPGLDKYAPTHIALKASASQIGWVGTAPVFELEAQNIEVLANFTYMNIPGVGTVPLPYAINFASTFPETGGFEVPTGGDPVLLDMEKLIIRASVTRAKINIGGILTVDGNMAFEFVGIQNVKLTDGTTKAVTTASLGISNAFAFIGFGGPYQSDTNGDLVINASDGVNAGATGISMENFTLGIVLMTAVDLLDNLKFFAVKGSVDFIGLRNMPGITAQATSFNLEINAFFGLSLFSPAAVVDFTQFEGGSYQFEVGSVPIIFDFDQFQIKANGAVEFNIFEVLNLHGVFDFELSETRILIFTDAELDVVVGGATLLSFDALGLLNISANAFAARLELALTVSVPGVEFDAAFQLFLNLTGQEFTYQVPVQFQGILGYSSVTISAGAPQIDGSFGAPGAYFVIKGNGDLKVGGDLLVFEGSYFFEISEEKFEIQINASINVNPLGTAVATGLLRVSSAGIVASLQLALASDLGGPLFSLDGQFLLEVNTTSSEQTVFRFDVDTVTGEVGAELIEDTIDPNTFRLLVAGELQLAAIFVLKGKFELIINDSGIQMFIEASLDLLGFGSLAVDGEAAILTEDDGTPIFAAKINIGAKEISVGVISVEGNFTLEVNTSGSVEHAGVAPTTFLVRIAAKVKVLVLSAEGEVVIGLENGLFKMELNDLVMDFFGFAELKVNGFIRSDGQFSIEASLIINIDLGPIELIGGFEVSFSNSGFTGRIFGEINLSIDFGLFSIDITLGGLEAIIAFDEISARASLKITVLGISFRGSIVWSFGTPVIATQIGGVLRLNAGVDGAARGSNFEDITVEDYTILHVGGTAGNETIKVKSLGKSFTFTGVSKILVNDMEDGDDFIYIDPNVLADFDITGGIGNDFIYATSRGGGIVNGGDGDDLIIAGLGAIIINGGAGNDDLRGSGEDDTIYGEAGDDTITGEGGNDFIDGGAGNDDINAGEGNDVVFAGTGNDTVDGGAGTDLIIAGLGADSVLGGTGADIIVGDNAGVNGTTNFLSLVGVTVFSVAAIGNGDDDNLQGEDGDDILIGGGGNDTITGGSGDDFIAGDNGLATLSGGVVSKFETTETNISGTDNLDGGSDDDVVFGGSGQDTIEGGSGDDILFGDNGLVTAGNITSTSASPGDNDTITDSGGSNFVFGGPGVDTITTSSGIDTIFGDAGTISFTSIFTIDPSTGGNDIINSGSGNDIIFGGFGNDQITNPSGAEIIFGDNGSIGLFTGIYTSTDTTFGGQDSITSGSNDFIFGGPANDTINITGGNNYVFGDNGKITVVAFTTTVTLAETIDDDEGGNDDIDTATGNDTIFGGFGNDTIDTTGGNNIIFGDNGKVVVNGDITSTATTFGGQDTINSQGGDDYIIGGRDDDIINARGGNNIVFGDNGKISRTNGTATQNETLDDDEGGQDDIDTLTGNDSIFGGDGNDTIDTTGGNNIIFGDNGAFIVGGDITSTTTTEGGIDTINSDSGNDYIIAGPFADTVNARGGMNIVFGDNGKIYRTNSNVTKIESLDVDEGGNDDIDTLTGVDYIVGGFGNDTIDSTGGNNIVFGDNGEIITDGNITSTGTSFGGRDTINTGEGNDTILGGPDQDGINAGDGNNTVFGDNGQINRTSSTVTQMFTTAQDQGDNDTIITGSGTDYVLGGNKDDNITTNSGTDFVAGDHAIVVFATLFIITTTDVDNDNTVNGGNDTISTGAGNDVVLGGTGVDNITLGTEDDVAIGDQGLYMVAEIQTQSYQDGSGNIIGAGNDTIFGNENSDIILGGDLQDTIHGKDGLNTGDDGGDYLFGDNGTVKRNAAGTIVLLLDSTQVTKGDNDIINGDAGVDYIIGGTLEDTINGGLDTDIIFGDHALIDPTVTTTIDAFSTDFTDEDLGGNDTIHGNEGDDFIWGQQGADNLFGDAGEDDITGGHNVRTGSDVGDNINGGSESDFIMADNGIITRILDTGGTFPLGPFVKFPAPFSDTQRNVQRFDDEDKVGGDDVVNGDEGNDQIVGQRGNDILNGNDGDDEIIGGLGDDIITGGEGNDVVLGDQGVIARVTANAAGLGNAQRDVITLDTTYKITHLINIDSTPIFSAGDQFITDFFLTELAIVVGNYNADGSRKILPNGAWDVDLLLLQPVDPDTVGADSGLGGNDIINGNAGDDALYGQNGRDTLIGEEGDDLLSGGSGIDDIDGGPGNNKIFAENVTSTTSFDNEFPRTVTGIYVTEVADGLDIVASNETAGTEKFGGSLLFPKAQLTPILVNDRPVLNAFTPESLGTFLTVKNSSMAGTDGRIIRPLISMVTDVIHHLHLLPSNDVINATDGDDFIVGDETTTTTNFVTNNPTLDNLFKNKVIPALTKVMQELHEAENLFQHVRHEEGLATEPHDIRIGNDIINGGGGNDIIVGDNATIVAPMQLGVLGESADSLVESALSLVRDMHDLYYAANDMRQVVLDIINALMDQADPVSGRNRILPLDGGDPDYHDIIVGNDELNGELGDDLLIGDNLNVLAPIFTGNNSLERRSDPLNGNVDVILLDLELSRSFNDHEATNYDPFNKTRIGQDTRLYTYDEVFGNDTLNGGEGNDVIIGDYSTIGLPVFTDDANQDNLEDEYRTFSKTVDDFEKSIQALRAGRQLDHTLTVSNDIINGGEGNDTIFGEYARVIRPFTTSGLSNRDFEFIFSETGFLPFSGGKNILFGQDNINGNAGNDILLGQGGGQNILDGVNASSVGDARDLIIEARMFARLGGEVNPVLDDLIQKLIATDGDLALQGIINFTFFG